MAKSLEKRQRSLRNRTPETAEMNQKIGKKPSFQLRTANARCQRDCKSSFFVIELKSVKLPWTNFLNYFALDHIMQHRFRHQQITEYDSHAIKSLARLICLESKATKVDAKSYCNNIDEGIASGESSATLLLLLSESSFKLSRSLTRLFFLDQRCNKQADNVVRGFGYHSKGKSIMNTFHDVLATCSFCEVLYFTSTATSCTTKISNFNECSTQEIV